MRDSGLVGAGAMRPVSAVVPSLEDRLSRLSQACNRLSGLREQARSIANGIDMVPPPQSGHAGNTDGGGLSERFGAAIAYVHDSIDDIESTLARLESLLFTDKAQVVHQSAAQCPAR
jgi:hypothetical protein